MFKIVWESKNESLLKIRAGAGLILLFFSIWFFPILLGKIAITINPKIIGTTYTDLWFIGFIIIIVLSAISAISSLIYLIIYEYLKSGEIT